MHQPKIPTASSPGEASTPVVAPGRRLPNWIESFIDYTSPLQSPEVFRRWTAISLIASALERRVWAHTKGSTLWPNLYVVLVAPAGVGKSQILSVAETLLRRTGTLHIAPSSLTTASLIDSIADATSTNLAYNSLQVIASELGVFLPAYEPSYMNTLTKLYDGEHYEERRRTRKPQHLAIDHPLLSILGGVTPSYLNSFLPNGAWDQGFTSRTIFIYSDEVGSKEIWGDSGDAPAALEDALIADLTAITATCGQMEWSLEARIAISAWDREGLPPIPSHSKLTGYNSRRLTHLLKLCMVSALATSSTRTVTLADYLTARRWLLEAERLMPEIFNGMIRSTDGQILEDLTIHMHRCCHQSRAISEVAVIEWLRVRVPAYTIDAIVRVLDKSGDFEHFRLHNQGYFRRRT